MFSTQICSFLKPNLFPIYNNRVQCHFLIAKIKIFLTGYVCFTFPGDLKKLVCETHVSILR